PLWSLAGPPVTFAAVLACVAADAPWPAVPAVTLAAGLVTALAAAIRPTHAGLDIAGRTGAVTCWFTAGAGLAGCLATEAATLTALAAVLVVAAVIGAAGRAAGARTAGWLVASVTAGWLGFTAARAADLPLRQAAFWVLLAAAVVLAAAQVVDRLPRRSTGRPPVEAHLPHRAIGRALMEAVAHATAAVAFLLAFGHLDAMAGIAALWGVALGLRALLGGARAVFTGCAVGAELVAYWLVLAARDVGVVEAYTVPAGVPAVAAGWFAARRNPQLNSWPALAPGLLAAFAPSLAVVMAGEGEPLRRLLLGVAAVGVVLAGAVRRLQSPVVLGGAVLGLLAVHEVALYWDLLPRWAPLAVAGLVLVALATTYERRRRDLHRLKAAVTRMR
ncbi:SCO7613 C-terminal domain-containing membrane protein, partial [Dactylosporangium fulvum]|uniref:SCO7613 C-terminal domain-containing membrane protein n=1 Tax=Dactylosporangium fulvum TaxID=53359 RepID=UPI003CD0B8C2